jgi:amino acid adenylation domain-containing protein
VLEHRTLSTGAQNYAARIELNESSRVFNFAAFSFDVAFADIFYTLMFGGVVCMPSDRSRSDDLAGAINELRANQVYLTATVVETLLPSEVPGIERISVGGEPVSSHVVETWAGSCTLINIWGPAEATPWASWKVVENVGDDPKNIGQALGVSLFITDRDDPERLMPVGAVGEIIIDGPVLAREYLNLPDLTEKAFIPAPGWLRKLRGAECPDRVYRTGDIAAYIDDGCVRFLGRREHNAFAKIRGMRVELPEIEQHIRQIGMGAEVPVDVVEDEKGNRRLVAFVSDTAEIKLNSCQCSLEQSLYSSPGSATIASQVNETQSGLSNCTDFLLSRLRSDLPAAMIPHAFLRISQLPLSPNGKLDRRRLNKYAKEMKNQPSMDFVGGNEASSLDSEMETLLEESWCTVLSVQRAHKYDNFIALGGDSVKAMSLISLARRRNIQLSVKDLLDSRSYEDVALAAQRDTLIHEVDETPFRLLKNRENLVAIKACVQQSGENADVVDIYSALPIQESLLASSFIDENSYVMQNEYLIPKDIHLERFVQAWNFAISRNTILRTTFVTHSGHLWQVILQQIPGCETVLLDALETYLSKTRGKIAVLGTPFFQCAVVLPSKGHQARFILTIHHALYDGVTLQELWRYIQSTYSDDSRIYSQPSPLQHFVSFFCQKDWTKSEFYWSQLLKGHQLSRFPEYTASNLHMQADQFMKRNFRARIPGGVRFIFATYLKAAWGLTIAQYSSSKDVVYGTVVNGRSVPVARIDEVLGPTIATIPVRFNLESSTTVGDLLSSTEIQARQSLPHEHIGLQRIRQLSKELHESCDFTNLFVIQTDNVDPASYLGLQFVQSHGNDFVSYALTVEVTVRDEDIIVKAQFDPNAIISGDLSRTLRHFEHTLHRLVSFSPNIKLLELLRINSSDINDIVRWQSPVLDAEDSLLHHLVLRACDDDPEKVAIEAHDGQLTYRELQFAIQRATCAFKRSGIGHNMLVPVCTRKGVWAPVTFLAILSCGAAFLPIEYTWPTERICGILNQFGSRIAIASPDCESLFEGLDQSVIKILHVGPDMLCSQPHKHLAIAAQSSDTKSSDRAFVLMTSGSTGKPKGVSIQHKAIVTHCLHVAPALGCKASTRLYQFSSYAYDAAFGETFDTLIHGGTLCIPSDVARVNNLKQSVTNMNANFIALTSALLETMSQEDFPTIKTVLVAGDRVPQHINTTWSPHVCLIEAYGPAETCIVTAIRNASDNQICGNLSIPSWCALWVTDPDDPETLVSVGAVGELLVQGPILAKGYELDEEKTTSSFIPVPRWMKKMDMGWSKYQRLYRTGDLVKQKPDGTYQFIGRRDNLRKHRGQRLELGEIEHNLRPCLQGSESVIVELVVQKGTVVPCLVAFFQKSHTSLAKQTDLTIDQLISGLKGSSIAHERINSIEQHLARALPSYMIPSQFLMLKCLPLTISGKVDRRMLREAFSRIDLSSLSLMADENLIANTAAHFFELEPAFHILREGWAKVLGVSDTCLAVDSVWHRVGGDSIRAMHLSEWLKREGYLLSVQEILIAENFSCMASKLVDATKTKGVVYSNEPISNPISDNIYISFSQIPPGSLVSLLSIGQNQCKVSLEAIADILLATPLQIELMASTAKNPGTYISRQIWDLPDHIDLVKFQRAWDAVISSNPILRTRLFAHETGIYQAVMHDLPSWEVRDDLEEYLEEDRLRAYGLGDELIRFALIEVYDTNSRKNVFVWTCHHSIYDGRLMELIKEHLVGHYKGLALPTLTPFAQYIQYLRNQDTDKAHQYWQERLEGAIFTSFPESNTTTKDGASGIVELRSVLPHAESGPRYSPGICIQAALAYVLARWANTNDIVYAVTLNGRTTPIQDIENVAGPTMSTVPLRCSVDETTQVEALMEGIRSTILHMTLYQHLGIANIQRICNQTSHLRTHLILQTLQAPQEISEASSLFGNIRDDGAVMMESYPINIECNIGSETSEIDFKLTYVKNVLDEHAAARLLHQIANTAKTFSHCPTMVLAETELLSELDRAQIREWNAGSLSIDEECIHSHIEMVAHLNPDKPAIYSWDGEATYQQFRMLYRSLASQLLTSGVGPESMVPLVFEKSVSAVVAMLAVLTAGGCIVPLDPSHPVDRLKSIVDTVDANIVLCSPLHQETC